MKTKKTTARTAEETEFAMRDAHEALTIAVQANRWESVVKYAEQLRALQEEMAHTHGKLLTFEGVGTIRAEKLERNSFGLTRP